MKNVWREEPWYQFFEKINLQQGHGPQIVTDDGGPSGTLKAMLYLPDPDSRTGWQLHQVYSAPPKPTPGKKLGYR